MSPVTSELLQEIIIQTFESLRYVTKGNTRQCPVEQGGGFENTIAG